MKKAFLILFLLNGAFLYAQEAIYSVSPTTYYNMQSSQSSKQKQQTTDHPTVTDKQKATASTTQRIGQSEVMMINPEMRSKDLQECFDYLRKMSPASKLAVKLSNGTMVSEILDMQLMKGGTMIIFRTNSVQGQKFQVVKVEDIDTITNG